MASDKKAKVVVGSYAYSAEATEYYGLVSSEFIVDGEGTENNPYIINNLHELEAFRNAVNAGNDFSGKVFELNGDINLTATRAINNWEPIGTQANPFKGTFDGGNNTISNLVVEGENNVGLFGYADNATIKNVKLENVNVKGTDCVGAIAGQVYSTSLIDSCHVSGSIKVEGQTNVGGIVGKYYTKVTNSSVIGDGVATSYVKGVHYAADYEGDNIGGIMGHGGENNTFTNNTVKNITISGTRKVGGIVGVTDQNTDVTNCVVENVNIETTATAQYATDNAAKAGHASIVGSYTKLEANNNGTVTNCVVKYVTFVNNDNVTMSAGPITGGAREGMVDPTGVTASGNLVYMSTIQGNTTNMYLMNAVAKIDETKYYTLQEAVAASETNETTIDVIANTAETINVQEGANITINNINLTGSILAPNATLKIVNGSIVNNNSNVSAIEINDGTLNLEGVNITSARHAVRIDGAVIATIDGGTYKSAIGEGTGTYHALNIGNKTSQVVANVTITAGTFVGPKGTTADSGSAVNVQTGSTVTIEGGDFSGGKNATLGVSGEMIVKGGRFDQDPSAYLADAYTVNIENEMYVVRYTPIMVTYPVGNPVYPEGKVEYYSDMLEAVPYTTNCPRLEGATITLLADVSGAGMRFMENDMVFDLNGHTYTITAGTGSQGTNTSGFQIRPEVTTNVLFKNGTIKVAEGAPVVWMFNCYATDFIVENVTVDCSNMAYSYGGSCYVVVSREGDNVQLTGETKIVNFNSDVAGNAINVGDTMTIGEDVDLGGGTIELDGGAQLTAPAGLNVVTVADYMVVYENGVYKSVKVVAEVDGTQFTSLQAAINAADGKTVVVLDNITLTETVTVAAGTTVTLDLNGKNLTGGADVNLVINGELTIEDNVGNAVSTFRNHYVSEGGKMTLKSGILQNIETNTGGYGIFIENGGESIIEGGTVQAVNESNYAICVNGTLTIVDGNIVGKHGVIAVENQNAIVTIKDGEYTLNAITGKSDHIVYVYAGMVNIEDGNFTFNNFIENEGDSMIDADKENVSITGGTYTHDVNHYCHEYYDAIQGADNLWRVERVLFAQTTALQGGWNWFSSYVDLSTPDGLGKLQTALDGNGVQIKTQGNQFSFYQNNQWNSSAGFTSLYNEKMYMIQTTNDVNVELIGSVIDYANTVIVLNKGWNWISYPLDVNTEVNEALKNMSPSEGDIIKGYGDNTTSVYYTSDDPATPSAWWPSITLNPGQGYMYKSNTNTSFIYAAGNGTSAKVDSRDNNYWVAAKSQYANNMTIIAMLSIDNEIVKGDYEIAAFANGECRGSARPIYNEYLDAYILLLTVYGDEVEELTFKYYDIDTDTEYELSNVMNYSNDAIVGTLSDPYIFSMNILGIGENSIDNINIYPNPTTTDREINLQATCDKVEVFNALGVKVAEYHNVDTLDAFETAGIYVIRITNDNAVKHCRLVVK